MAAKDKLVVIAWNARGLYDKKTQLIQLINQNNADIVLVQETLINENTKTGKKNAFRLDDFKEFPFNRKSQNDENRGLFSFGQVFILKKQKQNALTILDNSKLSESLIRTIHHHFT